MEIRKYSVTMPAEVAQEARSRSGEGGFSAYVAQAVARQIERDRLAEIIEAGRAEHGAPSAELMEEIRSDLERARARQDSSAAGAA